MKHFLLVGAAIILVSASTIADDVPKPVAAPTSIINPQALAKGTVVINTPGLYRLGGNAIAGYLASGEPLIRVTADNVTLDLGGHTISMSASATSAANAGIEIRGASNVTISNGSFRELSGPGIYVVCDVDPAAQRCANFTFSELAMRNVGKRGEYGDLGKIFVRPFSGGIVVFGQSTAVPAVGDAWENSITGVHVSTVTIRNDRDFTHEFTSNPPAGGQNGLTFISVSDLRVEQSAVSGMTANDAAACIFLGRIKGAIVRRFDCRDVKGDRNANGLDSMANVASPLAIKKNFDVLMEDSSFANILATGPRGNEALGVELNGEKYSFNRITVTDVRNDNSNAQGSRAIGIQVTGNAPSNEVSRITECTVRNVTQQGSGRDSRAGGVSIEASPPVVVSRCSVANVANLGAGPNAIKAFGFRVEQGAKKIVFEDNTVEGVAAPAVTQGGGSNLSYAAGFALVNAHADMSRNTAARAPVGLFARNLTTDAGIVGNLFQCNDAGVSDAGTSTGYARNRLLGNATATIPAALLAGTNNSIAPKEANDCPSP